MAMTKQLWSINALSVELGIDRRTIAKRLEEVPPAKIEGNIRLYYMANVMRVIMQAPGAAHDIHLQDMRALTTQNIRQELTNSFLLQCDARLGVLACLVKARTGLSAAQCWKIAAADFFAAVEIAEKQLGSIEWENGKYLNIDWLTTSKGLKKLEAWLARQDLAGYAEGQ